MAARVVTEMKKAQALESLAKNYQHLKEQVSEVHELLQTVAKKQAAILQKLDGIEKRQSINPGEETDRGKS